MKFFTFFRDQRVPQNEFAQRPQYGHSLLQMMSPSTERKWTDCRPGVAVLLLFAVAIVLGTLIAPHVFNLVTWLGREFSLLESLRKTEFEKLMNRCVMVCVLLTLYPAVRLTGLDNWKALGLSRDRRGIRLFWAGWIVGTVSMVFLMLAGWASGAMYYLPGRIGWPLAGKVVSYMLGAVVVAVIEETLFRGAVLGMLRKSMNLLPAALLMSFVFAFAHFATPEPEIGVVRGHWDSGFQMFPYIITDLDLRWEFGFMFITVFFMSMTLCYLYAAYGNLYLAIGLHAGWVWLMRIGGVLLERDDNVMMMMFGPSMSVAKSGLAIIEVLLFFAAAVFLYSRSRKMSTGPA